jgi:hypothetical protein
VIQRIKSLWRSLCDLVLRRQELPPEEEQFLSSIVDEEEN